MYKNINEFEQLFFSNCDGCEQMCCTGSKFSLAPLVLEDFERVYKYFPILFGTVNDEFKAFIPLNNGKESCPYLDSNLKCSIYESRPPACRLYPISPYFDQLFVDTSCKAVGFEGDFLVSPKYLSNSFYDKRLENFVPKLEETKDFLELIKNDLEHIVTIHDIKLYKYNANLNNTPIQLHLQSLSNLDKF